MIRHSAYLILGIILLSCASDKESESKQELPEGFIYYNSPCPGVDLTVKKIPEDLVFLIKDTLTKTIAWDTIIGMKDISVSHSANEKCEVLDNDYNVDVWVRLKSSPGSFEYWSLYFVRMKNGKLRCQYCLRGQDFRW